MRRYSPAARAMSWPIFAVRGIAAWFPIIAGRTDVSSRLALWRGDGCLTAPLSGYCSRRLSRYCSCGGRDCQSCRGANKTECIQPHFDSPTACSDRPGGGGTWRVPFTGGEIDVGVVVRTWDTLTICFDGRLAPIHGVSSIRRV